MNGTCVLIKQSTEILVDGLNSCGSRVRPLTLQRDFILNEMLTEDSKSDLGQSTKDARLLTQHSFASGGRYKAEGTGEGSALMEPVH